MKKFIAVFAAALLLCLPTAFALGSTRAISEEGCVSMELPDGWFYFTPLSDLSDDAFQKAGMDSSQAAAYINYLTAYGIYIDAYSPDLKSFVIVREVLSDIPDFTEAEDIEGFFADYAESAYELFEINGVRYAVYESASELSDGTVYTANYLTSKFGRIILVSFCTYERDALDSVRGISDTLVLRDYAARRDNFRAAVSYTLLGLMLATGVYGTVKIISIKFKGKENEKNETD